MKLRLLGNSLRLRIQQAELAALHQGKTVQEVVQFGPNPDDHFMYSLSVSDNAEGLDTRYEPGHIAVLIPQHIITDMVETERVGIKGNKKLNDQTDLTILIEKDFKCLTVREEDKDAFPHPDPDASHSSC